MKRLLIILIIGFLIMGFFYLLKNNNQQEMLIENQNLEKPERTKEFESLSEKAYKYLNEQQKIMEEKYELGKYEKWFYDQETGLLTFSDGDIVKLKIRYEEVGSISKVSETWLWAWANPNLEKKVKTEIVKVKEYGKNNNLEPLIKRKWNADQYDGWELTGISAYLMNAKGAYRVTTENTYSFMIFKEVIDLRNK